MMMSFSGAKNTGNFRSNVEKGNIPSEESITYEGVFSQYFFQTGTNDTDKLVDANFFCSKCPNPLTNEIEKYVGVQVLSSEDGKNHRDPLNLVIVLDISGSMGFGFNFSFYSSFEKSSKQKEKLKMDIANDVLVNILQVLQKNERVGIVLFNNTSRVLQPLREVGMLDIEELSEKVREITADGGTNMERGMNAAIEMLEDQMKEDSRQTNQKDIPKNNRIIFLTDAHPNIGGGPDSLIGITAKAAGEDIFTSFIGVGLDFNNTLVNKIGKIKGSNYYSVTSEREFKKILNEDFNYLVTPLVFNTVLLFESEGFEIEKVYGTPHSDESSGVLTKIDTMCGSAKNDKKGVKGSFLLLKLKDKKGEGEKSNDKKKDSEIKITIRYEVAATGEKVQFDKTFHYNEKIESLIQESKIHENSGIRKAILLERYVSLMKKTIQSAGKNSKSISEESKNELKLFKTHFKKEIEMLQDKSLSKELDDLDRMIYME